MSGERLTTEHRVHFANAQNMGELDDDSVELVVTSPPYPMIEMWDDVFAALNPDINECLTDANSQEAFELMHKELDAVWHEVERVLVPGGIACLNIGDATRKLGGTFQLFPNHARITQAFQELDFAVLPSVLWRKPTNKANKFMGSGMLPPNAYVTLEHEHILILRNGDESRAFEPKSTPRYESACFWEERNQWYSNIWNDIRGEPQGLGKSAQLRERSAAYPLKLPYRLINMYSVRGDTVLDPFWGTGTTTLAAMVAARNSVGYELDDAFKPVFSDRLQSIKEGADRINRERLENHRRFIADYGGTEYTATNYDTPVVTRQECDIRFYGINDVQQKEDCVVVEHDPYKA